jgi:hypothetical protein
VLMETQADIRILMGSSPTAVLERHTLATTAPESVVQAALRVVATRTCRVAQVTAISKTAVMVVRLTPRAEQEGRLPTAVEEGQVVVLGLVHQLVEPEHFRAAEAAAQAVMDMDPVAAAAAVRTLRRRTESGH